MDSKILSLEEIKKLNIGELQNQADLIRNFIIKSVSATGGHLSSNLGVVELTLALHYVFDSPFDKLIFDVGHQDYTHKILTGRIDEFNTLRKLDGISGFPSYKESEHDVWESGHSSTSIGAAIGFLEAKKVHKNNIGEIVSIIGDGSFANGLALSSLNYLAGNKKDKVIIIMNDNEMSISKNVGGIAKKFSGIRIKKSYQLFRKITFRFVREGLKALVYHHNIFTSLGFKYLGPIDGHDMKELVTYLNYAKNFNESIVLHIKTKKGKGYPYSERDNVGSWHGVGPFDIASGKSLKSVPNGLISYSNLVGKLLLEKVNNNKDIKVITPAMTYGCGLEIIRQEHKDQIIDVGINEELALLIAASMSRNGVVPVVSIYSTFIQRAYDELNNDINRSSNHVVILLDRSGIVPSDGATHQGIYDIALFNHLNNFIVSMPSNGSELNALLDIAIRETKPFVIRYPKNYTTDEVNDISLSVGKWNVIRPVSKTNVITYGVDVVEFNEEINKSGKDIGLINAIFIKPIDTDLLDSLNNTNLVIYEQVIEASSLGEIIEKYIFEKGLNIKVTRHFVKDKVREGTIDEIKDLNDLNISKIVSEL